MTTHLPHWSKLSFHKKSKIGAEGVGGGGGGSASISPKNYRKTRSSLGPQPASATANDESTCMVPTVSEKRDVEEAANEVSEETSENNNKEDIHQTEDQQE